MSVEKFDGASIEKIDIVINTTENTSPAAIQARFTTLCDLNDDQMAELNKRVLRRIDWRMMPTITIMFKSFFGMPLRFVNFSTFEKR